MTVHGVGLVRGINVGPTTKVPKADLVAAFEGAGLTGVTAFLQSGNVVFDAERSPSADAAASVEAAIAASTGVRARVLLIEEDAFRAVADANPLTGMADDHSKLVVTFLSSAPPADLEVPPDAELAPEVVRVGQRAIYQWCPLGVSRSKLKPSFWRRTAEVATGRNWRTVLKLIAELDART